ncbi:MAG: HAD family hydrolase [Candidatus Bathyarchaeota archaeon]|nr:HAD family hydrolase [Candidatus Bathyarchaeota archaeon]
MMVCKAIIFDYIGTLVYPKNYSMNHSMLTLHKALVAEGFDVEQEKFLKAYKASHEKFRLVRYGQFREVTNAVWVSETLNSLGYHTSVDDAKIKVALNIFFKDFIDSLELREGAKELLKLASAHCKVALISNFTYAPVIHWSLRKFGIHRFFSLVVVSHDCGWRKPSPNIFNMALSKLGVTPQEAVFIGDSPMEDIKGALEMGFKTVFVSSPFSTKADLDASNQKPDFFFEDLNVFCHNFSRVVESI